MSEVLRMWFPISMVPERVNSNNVIYTQDTYNSVLSQLAEGRDIYDNFNNDPKDSKLLGKTIGVCGNSVQVEIFDKDVIRNIHELGNRAFSIGTVIEGDVDLGEDGYYTVNSAKVLHAGILLKSSVVNYCDDVCVVKEPTLRLDE